jgi:hypothetical protein
MRNERRGRAHARRRGRGLTAGVPAPNDDDVEAQIHPVVCRSRLVFHVKQ